jgi:glycosyltransferase involved in cell wall biosynthesis
LNKPKIAVLIDWYLPGTKAGGPVRSVYSLVELLKDEFEFYIITTNVDLGEKEPYKTVDADKLFSKSGINYYYFSKPNLNTPKMLWILNQIKPDLIYLNSFWSFHFSINIIQLKNKGEIKTPVLLAPRGMLGKGALGLKSLKKRGFIAVSKMFGWYRNLPFHATQEQEKKDILSVYSSAKVFLAPNVNSGTILENKTDKKINELKLFFLSRIARVKNLHFALEILKDIPGNIHIVYDIYGNLEETDYWKECEAIISRLPKNVKVNYKRELKFDEVQSVISQYHALYLPTLNENFGHSIVESLLSGCPVIISDQTPWNDVGQNNAGYALALDDRPGFMNAIIKLATLNQEQFSAKSKQANNYISKKIDLQSIKDQYNQLFHGGIKN